MKLLGSVPPDEVPPETKPGVWADLAATVVQDHVDGRVTHLQVDSREELAKMRNNLAHHLHKHGYGGRTTVVEKNGVIDVYIEARSLEPARRRNRHIS